MGKKKPESYAPRHLATAPQTLGHLTITLSKTADGKHDYLQIITDDQFAINIVLIADKIDVKDVRK